MVFLKENLLGKYTWGSDESASTFAGEASRRLFDRFNGEQMLFMINLYGSLQRTFTIEDGHKIEEDINQRLPLENQSEISVLAYLKELNMSGAEKQKDAYMHHVVRQPQDE